MNFDYGDTLKRAAQMTLRYKSFWVLMTLQMLPSMIMFPLFFYALWVLENSRGEAGGVWMVVLGAALILLFFASFLLMAYSHSAVTLGVIRVDRGGEITDLMELLRDAFPFYGRSLGLILSIQLTIGMIFTVVFMIIGLLMVVTMGIGAICLQPVILLLTPLSMLLMAFMEAAQTALIAEDLGVLDSLKRALQVVRAHVWKYVIISLVVYFGTSIISGIISIPLTFPAAILAMSTETMSLSDSQMGMAVMASMFCCFVPVIFAISGVTQTFIKTTLGLSYLRLASPAGEQVITLEEQAS
ncbi:MAG TPA: hypothetical protein PKE35_13835 [Anaerolineales bacterium]|nr:hypothetical protein [Anaerolineales bacterium]HMX20291.1 hypothetical protein [Anaerolineales bacterium]HMX75331.1 hypothetical protein [Anaerolineales bacterium]HMZ43109.1 hypothetical protein [Anaerolineales bacterium]HNB87734.1 hypothetical protein [Anaerolineales bacterium]